MNDPKINPDQATLIDPLRLQVAAAEGAAKIEAEKQAREDRDKAIAWERQQRRIWKGIYPRPFRLAFAKMALAKLERDLKDAESNEG